MLEEFEHEKDGISWISEMNPKRIGELSLLIYSQTLLLDKNLYRMI